MIIIISGTVLIGLAGLIFAIVLVTASKKLEVKTDPMIDEVLEVLPKANCGACGFAGCSAYAEYIVKNHKEKSENNITLCAPGGSEVVSNISNILGSGELCEIETKIAFIKCHGTVENCESKYNYNGIEKCKAVNVLIDSFRNCEYSCFMFGDCYEACKFNAIKFEKGKIPEIIREKCVGCGACVKACPQKIIELAPAKQKFLVECSNHDKAKLAKSKCKVACFGCTICMRKCPAKAIKMDNNLPVIDYKICKNCGICYQVCPVKPVKVFKSI